MGNSKGIVKTLEIETIRSEVRKWRVCANKKTIKKKGGSYMDFNEQLKIIGHHQLLIYTCPDCGIKDEVTKKNFLRRKNKCLFCAEQQKKIARENEIKQDLLEKGIEIIGEIPVNVHNKVNFKCVKCGKEDVAIVINLKRERKKCNCNPKRTFQTNITHEEFLEKVSPAIKAKFIIIDKYKNRNTRMLVECKHCHIQSYKWGITLIDAENISCRCESRTKGEDLVFRALQNIGITDFIEQHRFKGESDRTYILDFYIPSHRLVIEYNGPQHYRPIDYFGGEEKFKRQVIRDNYIQQYCTNNNLTLLIFKDNDTLESITHTLLQFSKTFND